MIELVVADRCTGCNACVSTCPTNVFDAATETAPVAVIARQDDCQTCFLCELYCPHDALYVSPEADRRVRVDAKALVASGLLGQFRRDAGWGEDTTARNQHWRMYEIFGQARALAEKGWPTGE